jgi:hypothetical protein
MVKRIVIVAFLCIFAAFMVAESGASLMPMSWGFPVLTQNQTLSTTSMQLANASDLSTSSVSFPTSTTSGILSSSFPTILQAGDQDATQLTLTTSDATADSSFMYPWFSMGGSAVPSMGLL